MIQFNNLYNVYIPKLYIRSLNIILIIHLLCVMYKYIFYSRTTHYSIAHKINLEKYVKTNYFV